MEINTKRLLTVADVAAYLQLSEKTVLGLIKKKEIPCMKIANQWRFSYPELNEWLTVKTQNEMKKESGDKQK